MKGHIPRKRFGQNFLVAQAGLLADPGAGSQPGEIELQGVALVDRQALRQKALAQAGDQVAVDLDHVEMPEPLGQRRGQGAQSRPDLDQPVAGPGGDGGDDPVDDGLRDQEVLAEALPRYMTGHARARPIATSIAANRLCGLAWPVPASSSAVP